MPFVFSYGTLQQAETQMSTFGRLLAGHHDELPGYEVSSVMIGDPAVRAGNGRTHHDNVTFNGRNNSRVSGTVFEITEAELADADRYEQKARYVRITVQLASGRRAWVYVDARTVAPQ